MSDFSGVELREVSPCFKLSMAEVNKLLDSSGLKYEKLDYMAALFDVDGKAVACGGYSGTTIKCVIPNCICINYCRCYSVATVECVISNCCSRNCCRCYSAATVERIITNRARIIY